MNDNKLSLITGGKSNYSLFMILGGFITFIIGVIDGYVRPSKCE